MPFLIALISAFISSAPIGPINLCAISRFSEHQQVALRRFILGVIVADTLAAAAALMGIAQWINTASWHNALAAAAGIAFIVIGIFNIVHAVRLNPTRLQPNHSSHWHDALLGFTLCGANPGFLIFWISVVSASHNWFHFEVNSFTVASFLSGVAVGNVLWFYSLGLIVTRQKVLTQTKYLRIAQSIAAAMMITIGVSTLIKL